MVVKALLVFVCAIALVLLASLQATSANSQVVSRTLEYGLRERRAATCSRKASKGDLESKSATSDVILTGTVLNVNPTSHQQRSFALVGDAERHLTTATSNLTAIARIQVWRVVKGSLNDVHDLNKKKKKKRNSGEKLRAAHREVDADGFSIAGQAAPVLEVHGLWNSELCGSFVEEGDTRVFFLKKLKDRRFSKAKRQRRQSTKRGKKRRRRKKDSKNLRKAVFDKDKKVKRRMRESEKSESNTSDSIATVWKRMMRGAKKKQTKKRRRKKSRRSSISLLLLSADPARITLKTLDRMEEIALSYR